MRKFVLSCIVALTVAVPAHAENGVAKGRELRIAGPIVKVAGNAVTVENVVGDAMLTCAVPERLAQKVAAFEVGDKVKMHCVRYRGRRAQLVKLERLGARPSAEKPAAEKQEAAGPIVELGDAGIVVQSSEGRLACRVPEEKQAKLDGLKLGMKVKILCVGGVLAGLERYEPADKPADKPAGEEVRIYGGVAAVSRASVTVQGEAGSLTCAVPSALAEKVAGRFAVGDRVKMICRGSELVYLEKVSS